jgi:hypothetical protein
MKKLLYVLIAAMLLAALVGCNSCGPRRGSWFGNWFNRGDSCRTCESAEVYANEPGLLSAPILNNVPAAPRSTIEVLPGPVVN